MVNEKIKMVMLKAVSRALEYKKKNVEAEMDEIMHHVVDSSEERGFLEMGRIAAASKALKYKEIGLNDKEIIRKIMLEADEMIMNIDR